MKVNIKIDAHCQEPYAIIYCDEMTEEIKRLVDAIDHHEVPLLGDRQNRTHILKAEDVYMIRIEGKETYIYTADQKYYSRKRLYELNSFYPHYMRISKSCIVNMKHVHHVAAQVSSRYL
jgi:DNA-binding LytR/AlgR family response regulator